MPNPNKEIAAAATAAALGVAGGSAGAAPVTANELPNSAQVAQQDLATELMAHGLAGATPSAADIASTDNGRQNYLGSGNRTSFETAGALSGKITSVAGVPCDPNDVDCNPNPVPEPSTLPLAGLALVAGAAAAGLKKVSKEPAKEK